MPAAAAAAAAAAGVFSTLNDATSLLHAASKWTANASTKRSPDGLASAAGCKFPTKVRRSSKAAREKNGAGDKGGDGDKGNTDGKAAEDNEDDNDEADSRHRASRQISSMVK